MTSEFQTPAAIRKVVLDSLVSGESVGFVPTMGAFHPGHRQLMKAAGSENDRIVVSRFVNPTQFPSSEDARQYPDHADRDLSILESEGVDYLFNPEKEDLYSPDDQTQVIVEGNLTSRYEGEKLDNFFPGVTRVVCKLLNIIPAHRVYFGEKDLQQYVVVKKMIKDLHFSHRIRPVPVVRDERGIAFSSRNERFNEDDWEVAEKVCKLMNEARGEASTLDRKQFLGHYISKISSVGIDLDYLDIVRFHDFEPTEPSDPNAVMILAGMVGSVRLKDNRPLHAENIISLEQESS